MIETFTKRFTNTLDFALKIATLCILICVGISAQAQMTATLNNNANTLAQSLAGNGVQVSNAVLTCATDGTGFFTATPASLGIGQGIVLTTGYYDEILNPNDAANAASFDRFAPGDNDLDNLSGGITYDACVLEFDVLATGDTLEFDYIFASEEYNFYVNAGFNDVFGFFISGPGIAGTPNIALVPGTATPVSIDNVNCGSYGQYYICNDPWDPFLGSCTNECPNASDPWDCEYNGLTTMLTAKAVVIPCEQYHLKLAVGDVTDGVWDSGVFLREGSLNSSGTSITSQINYVDPFINAVAAVEGCVDGTFKLTLDYLPNDTVVLNFGIGGVAIMGTDYQPVATQVTFLPGDSVEYITITPIVDGVSEGFESVLFYQYMACTGAPYDTAILFISDAFNAQASPNTGICLGQPTTISVNGGSFITYAWTPSTGLSCTNCQSPIANPSVNTTYSVVITSPGGCTAGATVSVSVDPGIANAGPDQTICGLTTTLNGNNPGASQSNWSQLTGAGTSSFGNASTFNTSVTVSQPGVYTYVYSTGVGCVKKDTVNVTFNYVDVTVSPATSSVCAGDCVTLTSNVNAPPSLQTFSTSVPVNIFDYTTSVSPITVNNGCASGNVTTGTIASVNINIDHTYDSDLSITLIAPDGSTVNLSSGNGFGGQGYINTTFVNSGAPNITTGTPPYTGTFRPEAGNFSSLNGSPVNGNWTLSVNDGVGGDIGTIQDWSITFNVTPNITYSWSPSAGLDNATAASPTACPTSSTTYTLTVTACSCTYTATASIDVSNAATLNVNSPSVCANQPATITASGAQSYTWSPSAGLSATTGASVTATVTATTTYTVTGTFAGGCTANSTSVITINPPPTILLTPTDANCGPNSGAINITTIGSYSYLWSNGVTTQNLLNAAPGIYSVTATDASGCSSTASATIGQSPIPTLSSTVQNTTCGNSNGLVDVTVTAGTAPFTYAWSNGFTGEDLASVAAGLYTLTVTDANNCQATLNVTVGSSSIPMVTAATIDETCSSANGSSTLTVTQGVTPYNFIWSNGATTANVSNLSSGPFSVTVTDATGCVSGVNVFINSSTLPALTLTPTNETCSSGNGSIALVVSDGTPAFTYSWSNGTTTQDLTNVVAGTYDVTVADANGCTATGSNAITNAPPPTLSETHVNATCGATNGSIDITVNGGTAPFTFAWSNAATTVDIITLSSGIYSVTVTDANSCTVTISVTLGDSPLPTLMLTPTDATCGNANGSVTSNITSGGTAPFTYLWSEGSTTQNTTNVAAGTYNITVTDANGCSTTSSTTVNDIPGPTLSITPTSSTCGNANGLVTLTVNGGTAAFTYTWSNAATTQNLSNVSANTYIVTVTDASGCTATASATVADAASPTASTVITDAICELPNGLVTLTVSGGLAPFAYVWDNGATTQSLINVLAGSYNVTVTDANGCTITASATVGGSAVPMLTLTPTDETCGSGDGSISTVVASGTAPFDFTWSDGSTAQNLSNLSAGTFTVTVTDDAGCTATGQTTISTTLSPTLSETHVDATCGSSNGSIDLSVASGTAPYAFAWNTGETDEDIFALAANSYSVTVTDAAGCTTTINVTVSNSSGPSTSAATTDATCENSNGSIDLTIAGGSLPLTFAWNDGSTTEDITNLVSGTYVVTITDANSCSVIESIDISTTLLPTVTAVVIDETCDQANGSVTLTVGGTAPFTYLWDNGSTTQNLNALVAGMYAVTITDANGCLVSDQWIVSGTSALTLLTSTQDDACTTSSGGVDLTVNGGTSPFNFIWSNGTSTEDLSGLTSGSYDVTVSDVNGCSATISSSISSTTTPTATLTSTDATCGQSNGNVSVVVNSGTAPYDYAWSDGSTLQNLTDVTAGNYTLTITDANGCSIVSATSVSDGAAPQIQLVGIDANCGNSDGAVNLTVNGGTGVITYNWSDGATTQNLIDVPAATYSVTVTDDNGCIATANTIIATTSSPSLVLVGINASCGLTNGSIDLTVTGTAVLLNWSNGETTEDITTLPTGNYVVTVTDVNGCTATSSTTITGSTSPTVTAASTNATCENANGTATATVVDGLSPYVYSWSNSATAYNIIDLTPGNYDITVTDANGCTASSGIVIASINGPSISVTTTDANCGQSNGAIDITVSNGTTPYTYAWSNGSTTSDLSNIASGTYSITIMDANGCSLSQDISISDVGGPAITATTVNTTCGAANGSISLNVNGGTAPYTYVWSSGETIQNLSNVAAATYSITVNDATGCAASQSFILTDSVGPAVSSVVADASCGNINGAIDLSVSGNGPFSFVWSNGSTDEDLSSLNAGVFDVTILDVNGCSTTSSIQVTTSSSPTVIATTTNASCGNSNGSIDLQITDGTAPYTVLWDNGSTEVSLVNLDSGNYIVTITDANSCTVTANAAVSNSNGQTVSSQIINAGCGQSNGGIDITVIGGSTPYAYLWSDGTTTEDLSNIPAGSYDVTITDAIGCTTTINEIVSNADGPILTATAIDASCSNNDGSISITVNGGLQPYVFIWSSGETMEDLSNISSGTYTVTVSDDNGCTASTQAVVGIVCGFTISLAATDAPCESTTGSIDLTPNSGVQPLTFSWSNGATTEDLNGLVAGVYDVTVTDASGSSVTGSITVNGSTLPSATAVSVNASCGNSNGGVTLNIIDGTAPYTYSWNNLETTSALTGLDAGTYDVTVTDSIGCTAVASGTVQNTTNPIITNAITDASCGSSNGSIDITVNDGVAPYTFVWDNGSTNEDLTNLNTGVYNITMSDVNGCSVTQTISVSNTNGPVITLVSASDPTCGNSDGEIEVSVAGGTLPYTYNWNVAGSTNEIQNLQSGDYSLTVTDASGCSATFTYTLNNQNGPLITGIVIFNPTCNAYNGSVDITIGGGTLPYDILWSNGSTDEDLLNVGAASYIVIVTDANGCSVSDDAMLLSQAGPTLMSTVIDATCDQSNALVDVSVSGNAPFQYVWDNGETTEDLSNVDDGDYNLTVTDINGCTTMLMTAVANTPVPTIAATSADASCGQNNGSVTIVVNGGTTPYNFVWSDGGTTQDLTNVAASNYAVTITDASGCTTTADAVVNNSNGPTILLTTIDATCGAANGSVSAQISDGTAPYTFEWSDGSTTQNINIVAAGTYDLTVTDANGCSAIQSSNVLNTNGPTLQLVSTNANCGQSNGSIDATANAGAAPYTFLWDNGETTEDLSNVAAASYTLTVTDANGCVVTETATVTNSNGPTLTFVTTDETCDMSNGAIDISVSGGLSPYSYLWSNNETTEDISSVTANTYSITVADANGCTVAQSILISNTSSPTLSVTSVDNVNGGGNGSIDLTVAGGTLPYTFAWSNAATTEDLSALSVGTYAVTVTDANGCTAIVSIIINDVTTTPPQIAISVTDETCGQSNGLVDATVTGTTPFTYSWYNGATTEDLTGVSAGTYSVTVTDAYGITISASATVLNVTGPSASLTSVDPTCNSVNGSVDVTVIDGTAPYAYVWSNNATTEDLDNLASGTYSLTVTDANNCTVTINVTLTTPNTPTLSYTSTPSGCAPPNGSVNLSVTNGTQPYSFAWSIGDTTEDLSNIPAGSYDVTVIDVNNCSASISTVVLGVSYPSVTASATDDACGQSIGSVNASVADGTAPFTFSWSNGSTTQDLLQLPQGTYSLTVTDIQGCIDSVTAIVSEISGPTLAFSTSDEACYQANGSMDITPIGGTSPYSYAWSNSATTQNINNIEAGAYAVTLTDANGCSTTQDIDVGFIAGPSAQYSVQDATCYEANGAIDLTVFGGTEPYVFDWSIESTEEDVTDLYAGLYGVTVTDSLGCVVNLGPAVHNTPIGNVQLNGLVDTLCTGGSFNVTASGMNSYQWLPVIGLSSTSGNTITVTVLSDQTYTVIGTDQNGCTNSSSFTISAMPFAQIIANGPFTGCASMNVFLSCEIVNATGIEWWIDDELVSTESSPSISFSPGTYDVGIVALSPYGCNDTVDLASYIEIFSPPTSYFNYTTIPSTNDDPPTSFDFVNLSQDAVTYTWNFGDGTTDTIETPTHNYDTPGLYIVELIAIDEHGCADTSLKSLEVDPSLNVFVPNTFTPNGDGMNDLFRPYGKHIKSYRMQIYERWGAKIFDSNVGIPSWDGVFQDMQLNTGVFVYVLQVVFLNDDTKTLHGDITLLR